MPKHKSTGARKPLRQTRAVKGSKVPTRRGRVIEVAGTPNEGTYVDPLVIIEGGSSTGGPEDYDDPEDVYEGADDIGPGPFGNQEGR